MHLEFGSPSSPLFLNQYAAGRLFQYEIRIGLGETDIFGRLRFDALARIAQDIAGADLEDSGLDGEGVWILRRTGLRINTDVTYGSRLQVSTFCSGVGRSWASRRTVVKDGAITVADVASLWIQTDPETRAPKSLSDNFMEVYGVSADGRKVSTRLSATALEENFTKEIDWSFRFCDFDLIGHVNNVSYLYPLEEVLSATYGDRLAESRPTIDVIIEYRDGINVGSTYKVKANSEDKLNLDFYSGERLGATIRAFKKGKIAYSPQSLLG